MNRSVRNGLAIAGMAGGIFFLGQAVASADDGGTQAADANSTVDQSNASTDGGGGGVNLNGSSAEATNVDVTEVSTSVTGGDGGVNQASINTGVVNNAPIYSTSVYEPNESETPFTSVTFNSGDVHLTQEANGGDVNGSGNVAVAGGGDQTATATSEVTQSNTSEGDGHDWNGGGGPWNGGGGGPAALSGGMGGGGHDDGNANLNESSAEATNIHKVEVETNATGGNGGSNQAEINTGIIGNTFYCAEHATCTFHFTTGSVWVTQEANGGDVNGSGNVNIGHSRHADHEADCPKEHEAEVKPAVKPAAAPARHHHSSAPVSSSAQPSGQLAFTGSDVSLPLTVGLIALGLGIGLTAAGRRRETQTV
jgi:hypothetical protein